MCNDFAFVFVELLDIDIFWNDNKIENKESQNLNFSIQTLFLQSISQFRIFSNSKNSGGLFDVFRKIRGRFRSLHWHTNFPRSSILQNGNFVFFQFFRFLAFCSWISRFEFSFLAGPRWRVFFHNSDIEIIKRPQVAIIDFLNHSSFYLFIQTDCKLILCVGDELTERVWRWSIREKLWKNKFRLVWQCLVKNKN